MESSIINNTMLIQIALLAWLFLGETPTWRMVLGMVLAGLGTLLVEVRRQRCRTRPGRPTIHEAQ
jgi:drug/metabolite transporter (DMT)-like permease